MSQDTFHNIRPNGLATVADSASRLSFIPPNDGYTVVELDTHAIWIWNASSSTWIAGGGGVSTYPTFANFPSSSANGTLALALDTDNLYVYNTGSSSWILIAGPGSALSIGTFDSGTPSANGAHIDSGQLIMQSGSGTNPGVINTGTQTIAGQKTFTTGLTGTLTGAASLNVLTSALGNLTDVGTDGIIVTGGTGAVVGAVSLAQHVADTTHNGYLSSTDWNTFNNKQSTVTIGSLDAQSPNANGLSLVSNVLSTQSADATRPGLVNNTTQTFGGKKTFNAGLDANSNQITSVADPTTAQMAATKNYVDTQLAALNPADAVYAASTTNIPGTYLNGVAGVGATFVTTATGTFTIDGVTPSINARILIKNQTSGFQNGIYNITTVGSLGVSTVFTRSLDYNTASDMNSAGLVPVINGTVNALSSWQQVATITTVGTDNLTFTEFTANPSLYLLKANNLTDLASRQTSLNNLAGAVTSANFLRGDGTNVSMSPIQASDVPTLNQNTTGTSSNVTGVVATTHGGTGINTTYTPGSVIFADSSGFLNQDNSKFFWDDTNFRLSLGGHLDTAGLGISQTGGSSVGIDLTTTTTNTALQVQNQGAQIAGNFVTAANSATQGGTVVLGASRGTNTARTASLAGDQIGLFAGQSYNSSNAFGPGYCGAIGFVASENQTSTHNGGLVALASTPNGSLAPVVGLTLNQDQTVTMGHYTTNGFVKFTGANGALGVDTNTYITSVTGDIAPTTWAGLTNNTSGQTVTGLTFATTVSSFEVLMNIQIVATSNTYTTVKILGTRRAASDWSVASIQAEDVGDAITGLAFDISSAGQVTMSVGSIAGFTSGSVKFRASVLS